MASKFEKTFMIGLPVGMSVIAISGYVDALLRPVLVLQGEPGSRIVTDVRGTVQGVSVQLADPSFADRFTASLPALSFALPLALAFLYCARIEWQQAKGALVPMKKKVSSFIAMTGIFVVLLPILSGFMLKDHFDQVQLSTGSIMDSVSVVGVTVVLYLVLTVISSRNNWAQEQRRAEKLDEQMKDVV